MKRNVIGLILWGGFLSLCGATTGWAQTAAAPPKVLTGSFGAGLALTGGNAQTTSFNLTFEMVRDPKTRNVIKTNGIYLRSGANHETTADQLSLGFRDDYTLSKNTFLYGAMAYTRDPFKDIGYLINPGGGIGYKVYTSDRTAFQLSGGGGVVWEKDTGVDLRTSGTLNGGQFFTLKISENSSISQSLSGLWKTGDFGDALYHAGIALVSSITQRIYVKVEFRDDYRTLTPNPTIKKNDTAFITSFLYKF